MQAKKILRGPDFPLGFSAVSKNQSIPLQFRVSLDLWEEIKQVSSDMGISQPALVRLCVTSMIRYCKENNVRTLPPDWASVISRMDGRRSHHPEEPSPLPKRQRKGREKND